MRLLTSRGLCATALDHVRPTWQVAKTILPSCCPPSYNIFDAFTNWYSTSLSASFRQIMRRNLENAEIIPLLSWLKAYKSEAMMGHPDFRVSIYSNNVDDQINKTWRKLSVSSKKSNKFPWWSKQPFVGWADGFLDITFKYENHEWKSQDVITFSSADSLTGCVSPSVRQSPGPNPLLLTGR